MKEKINQKVYWRRYEYLWNSSRKFIFRCGCSKDYVSFPALYLHCQKKHNIRISTKPTEEECRITQKNGQIIMHYNIEKNEIWKHEVSADEAQKIQREPRLRVYKVLQDFQDWASEKEQHSTLKMRKKSDKAKFKEIIQHFREFIAKITSVQDDDTDITHFLPFYFNGFVISEMEGKDDADLFARICTILLIFSNWLEQREQTDITVKPRFQDLKQKNQKGIKTVSKQDRPKKKKKQNYSSEESEYIY